MSPERVFFTETYEGANNLKFSETKGTCDLAYYAVAGERYSFPDGKVWIVLEKITGQQGFLAVILKSEDDNRVVLSFAGTQMENELPWKEHGDFKTDLDQEKGFVPYQYNRAVSEAQRYKQRYGSNLTLVGHSLGGGLASFASLIHRIPTNTVNPAPLSETNVRRIISNAVPPQNLPITNYIAGGREFISDAGLWQFISGGRTKPKLMVLGKNITVFGREVVESVKITAPVFGSLVVPVPGRIVEFERAVNYYANHLIGNTAPEVPLPVKLAAVDPHPRPPVSALPTPTATPVPTGTPTAR